MTKVARWETRGRKHWYELFEEEFQGKPSYHYTGDNCGGNIGWSTLDDAMLTMMRKVSDAKRYDNINLGKVQ